MQPSNMVQHFRSLVTASGLPALRYHDLRHTHATLALQAGVHPKVVAERVGHASTAFTMDTYSHVLPGLQAKAADALGRLVFGKSAGP